MSPEMITMLAARRLAAEAQLARLLALPEPDRRGPRGSLRAWEEAVENGRKLVTVLRLPVLSGRMPQKQLRDQQAPVLAKVTLGTRSEVCISVRTLRGEKMIDVRVWRIPKQGSAPLPTKTGITLDAGQVDNLLLALKEARAAVASRPC